MRTFAARLSAHWATVGIRARLAIGFSVLLSLIVITAAVGLQQLNSASAEFRQLIEVNKRRSDAAHRWNASVYEIGLQVRTLVVLSDPEDLKAQKKTLDEAFARYAAAEASLLELVGTGDDPELAKVRALIKEVQQIQHTIAPSIESVVRMAMGGGGIDTSVVLLLPMEADEAKWRQSIGLVSDELFARDQEAYEASKGRRSAAIRALIGIVVIALVIGVLIAWRLARSVIVPVSQATVVAERIAEGDLSSAITVTGGDELARLLAAISAMQDRLRGIVSRISASVESLSTASGEIAEGSFDLSVRTERTAARLQAASASIDGLAESVATSAGAARAARDLATSTRGGASDGGESVSAVIVAMDKINQSSRRVTDIVAVIDDIAIRTKLLALNAAVEAAHAGERGKGFAIVAGEVRDLAQRATSAAGQIKGLIGEALKESEGGNRAAKHAGDATNGILRAAIETEARVTQISQYADAQSGALADIDRTVKELDDLTQQNAALAEESAASAARLRAEAEDLTKAVGVFRLGEHQQLAGQDSIFEVETTAPTGS